MRRLVAVSLCLAALTGCQMLSSEYLETDPRFAGASCHSNTGAYHLPRRLLGVTVIGTEATGYSITVDTNGAYVADRNETYCLDFLLSYLSADRIGIQRDDHGLLERVFTNTDDKTLKVATDVIQAAADLVASNSARSAGRGLPQFQGATANTVAKFDFDPFVEREARDVNAALVAYGYCLYLDPRQDPFVPPWSEQICRELLGARSARVERRAEPVYKSPPAYPRSGLPIFDPEPVPKEVQARGILYRPELSHSLIVMRKPDPRSRHSPWRVAASDRIVMPNAAPAFLLEVKRALFVNATTDVQFKSGLIKSVSVDKPSELLALADFAVSVSQIIVNIPSRALLIFNNRAENTKELMKTNAELITVLRTQNVDAEGLGQKGTDLILGRNANVRSLGGPLGDNDPALRLQACLNDPASQQYPDPLRVCQEIVSRGL